MKSILKNRNDSLKQFTDANQSFYNLSLLLTILDHHQNILQAIRQVLTLRPEFNPETLFNYLTVDENQLTRRHIVAVMQENGEYVNDQQLKILFILAGCKDKMNFNCFLNFIYPYNAETLKIISTVNAKKYAKNSNEALTQDILCLFLMIIREQITFLHEFQAKKSQYFVRISRQKIKKMMKGIKRMNDSNKNMVHSDFVLKPFQLKNFIRKMKKTPENRINSVCRRLSIGNQEGLLNLEQFQFWLRPWNRIKSDENISFEKENLQKTLLEDITSQLQVFV